MHSHTSCVYEVDFQRNMIIISARHHCAAETASLHFKPHTFLFNSRAGCISDARQDVQKAVMLSLSASVVRGGAVDIRRGSRVEEVLLFRAVCY